MDGSQENVELPSEMSECLNHPEFQNILDGVIENPVEFVEGVMESQVPIPPPTCTMLCTDVDPGDYGFEMRVNGINEKKPNKSWAVSSNFDELFILMGAVVHFGFKCGSCPSGLYLRAIAVYCKSDYFQYPVERCLQHGHRKNKWNDGDPDHVIGHVVRILLPDAIYDYDETSGRRSVRILLDRPQAGSAWVNVPFKFTCQRSCPSGMNRREVELIFTLEDKDAFVHGRQKMKLKVCEQPIRDRNDKENPKNPLDVLHAKRHKCSKKNPELIPVKRRKLDKVCQILVFHEDCPAVLEFANQKLKARLQAEEKEPEEEEKQLLHVYEQNLKAYK